jgi:hypothetical protein
MTENKTEKKEVVSGVEEAKAVALDGEPADSELTSNELESVVGGLSHFVVEVDGVLVGGVSTAQGIATSK